MPDIETRSLSPTSPPVIRAMSGPAYTLPTGLTKRLSSITLDAHGRVEVAAS